MDRSNDKAFELTLAKERSGFSFIEPPLFSDAREYLKEDKAILVTDMNQLSKRHGLLHVLGKALYEHRTGIKKESILLSQLPKGYVVKRRNNRTFYIAGHPGGHILNTAMFIPHLIWLEKASIECECSCTACHLPSLNPISTSLISDLPSLAHEIENCTVESFKVLQSVVIKPPNDIYCKPFIVPVPVYPSPNTTLRETDNNESTC